MMSWLRAFIVALWLAAVPASAQSDAAAGFAETVPGTSGVTLRRIGTATVDRNFVPLYAIALYAPQSVRNVDQIRGALSVCRLSLFWFVPELDAAAVQDYWRHALENAAGKDNYPRIQPQAERLAQVFGSLKRGQHIVFDYVPDAGMRVLIDDRFVIQLAGIEFNRTLLEVWLGEHAAPDVRANLAAGFVSN